VAKHVSIEDLALVHSVTLSLENAFCDKLTSVMELELWIKVVGPVGQA